jgi:quercetin dioxygenase-like cupin family protein
MIQAGFETTDPLTQTRTIVIHGSQETEGHGWLIEVHCPVGARATIQEHFHLTWRESFEIIQGTAAYKLGGIEHRISAGEQVVMEPGIAHIHPWNAGSEVLIYRQTSAFGEANPDAVEEVLGVFATVNGLAREGKVDDKGLPKHPLQLAATMRTLAKHNGFVTEMPIGVQRALSATLGRLAEWLGYRGVYPRYITPQPE